MEFQAYDVALIPLVIAIVEIFSRAGVPSKYLPIFSIVLGLLLGVFYVAPGNLSQAIISGVVIGLSAVGTYSGVKNTVAKSQ
jgi:hypothetical protein